MRGWEGGVVLPPPSTGGYLDNVPVGRRPCNPDLIQRAPEEQHHRCVSWNAAVLWVGGRSVGRQTQRITIHIRGLGNYPRYMEACVCNQKRFSSSPAAAAAAANQSLVHSAFIRPEGGDEAAGRVVGVVLGGENKTMIRGNLITERGPTAEFFFSFWAIWIIRENAPLSTRLPSLDGFFFLQ